MKLLHTADWHLGRRLKGVDRTPELEAMLAIMLEEARNEGVSAVLVAGDLFEVPNPPAEAERVAFHFFTELARAGIPAVVIAGNHDSPARLEGLADLLALANVHVVGYPRPRDKGGMVELALGQERLRVGALPFASERRMLSADQLWNLDDVEQRQTYRQKMETVMRNLAGGFRGDGVNVLMAHLAMDTAKIAQSEVPFYTRDAYSLAEAILPGEAQYIALGHIHVPQRIQAAAPTYYPGSLIQLDFGEAGQPKGYNLVEVEAGRPAKVAFKELPCQRPLETVYCSAGDLDEVLEARRDHPGYLRVRVRLETPMVGLSERVRRICPQALQVEPLYPEAAAVRGEVRPDPAQLDPVEAFERYYIERLGTTPSAAVRAAFEGLYEEGLHAPA